MKSGTVVWITGLSGVGKTTLARRVVEPLRAAGRPVLHLDGDDVRDAVDGLNTGYDRASRWRNAERIVRLAALVTAQGFDVVVSTVSLFHGIHATNRRRFASYFEVVVDAEPGLVRAHDHRGVYRSSEVVGVSLRAEMPHAPHQVVHNDFVPATLDAAAASIRQRALLA